MTDEAMDTPNKEIQKKTISLRSPNGWQRLGILISIVIAVPSFVIAFESNRSVYLNYNVPIKLQKLTGQKFVNEVYWDARSKESKLSSCEPSTITVESDGFALDSEAEASIFKPDPLDIKHGRWTAAIIKCDKVIGRVVLESLPDVLVSFLIVFGIGYTFAWIASGFRQGSERRQIDISIKSIRSAVLKTLIYVGIVAGLMFYVLSSV
jgi:hypothetical protein